MGLFLLRATRFFWWSFQQREIRLHIQSHGKQTNKQTNKQGWSLLSSLFWKNLGAFAFFSVGNWKIISSGADSFIPSRSLSIIHSELRSECFGSSDSLPARLLHRLPDRCCPTHIDLIIDDRRLFVVFVFFSPKNKKVIVEVSYIFYYHHHYV